MTTWRARRRSSVVEAASAPAGRRVRASRSARTPSSSRRLLAGRATLGVLAVDERCGARVSMTSSASPCGGQVERDVLDGEGPGVEEERVAPPAVHDGHLVHDAGRGARRSRSRRAGDSRASAVRSRASPDRSTRASAVAHSSAAEDDSPAPGGTSPSTTTSRPRTGGRPRAGPRPPRRRTRPSRVTPPGVAASGDLDHGLAG